MLNSLVWIEMKNSSDLFGCSLYQCGCTNSVFAWNFIYEAGCTNGHLFIIYIYNKQFSNINQIYYLASNQTDQNDLKIYLYD